jgi:hypothetical protein
MPGESSEQFGAPIVLHETTTLRARAFTANGAASNVATAEFVRYRPVGAVTLATRYNAQYTGGGDNALVDGRRGGNDWRLGAWQGYQGDDVVAVIDLGNVRSIGEASLGCLQDQNSWIFFPSSVRFSLSEDGEKFDSSVSVPSPVSPRESGSQVHEFTAAFVEAKARYLRVEAMNIGVCPDWHHGRGGKAWVFVDEITIR